MQARKAGVAFRRPKESEVASIRAFLHSLGAPSLVDIGSLMILDVAGGDYCDVFEVTRDILGALGLLGTAPYSAGLYIGLIDKPSLKFKPSLPLAMRACRLCLAGAIRCFTLKEREALAFTYGKKIRLTPGLGISGHRAGRIRPVLSEGGACLGWGAVQRRGSVKYLRPLLDLGWYLRRGG